jgi:DNA-binding protein HU-beta
MNWKGIAMKTADLADKLATEHSLPRAKAKQIIDATFEAIVTAATSGEETTIPGFGRFKVNNREARQGRSPATGLPIQIRASRTLSFAAAKHVRDKLNPPA